MSTTVGAGVTVTLPAHGVLTEHLTEPVDAHVEPDGGDGVTVTFYRDKPLCVGAKHVIGHVHLVPGPTTERPWRFDYAHIWEPVTQWRTITSETPATAVLADLTSAAAAAAKAASESEPWRDLTADARVGSALDRLADINDELGELDERRRILEDERDRIADIIVDGGI